ncbi:hypothetical protein D917_10320, partial [Trichinella nativa]
MPGMKPPDPSYCFNLQQFYPQQTAKCIDVAYGCDGGGMVATATGPLPFAGAVDVNHHHVVPALADEELLLTAAPLTAAAPAPTMGLSIVEQQQHHHHHPSQVAGSYFSCSNQSSSPPVMIDSSIPASPDFDSYVLLNDTGANGSNVDLVPTDLRDSNDHTEDDENGIIGSEFPCSPVSGSTIATTDDSANQPCNDTVDTVDSGVAASSLSTSQNSSKTDDTSEQQLLLATDDPTAVDSQFTDHQLLPQQQSQLSDEGEEENRSVVISSEEEKQNHCTHGDEPLQNSTTVGLSACADEKIAEPVSTLTAPTPAAFTAASLAVKSKTHDVNDGASISSRSSINDATTATT